MHRGPARHLPQVGIATFFVVGLPALIVSGAQGIVHVPTIPAMALAVALSFGCSRLGSALWMRRPGSRDIVFGDLMVWGWLRRMRAERRLAESEQLLGDGDLSTDRRTELLKALAAGLEARDPYTAGHSSRVARHSEAIAGAMGLSREQVAKVRTAAAIHDVGKIRTPRAILTKPGRLTDSERAVMEAHARDGAGMVAALDDAEITAMVEFHHERLDGSGYPDGLSGSEIPLGARIIAVADTFDAMTSSRPYSPGQRHKRAMDVLAAESPQRLDPRAVAAFRRHYTGERAVPASALIAAVPQRLGSWLAGVLQGEGALPLAQRLSALGAAALLGGSAIGGGVSVSGGSSQQAQPTAARAADVAPRPIDEVASRRPAAGDGERTPSGDREGRGGGTPRTSPRATPGRPPSGGTPTASPAPPAQQSQPSPSGQVTPPPGLEPGDPVRPKVTVTPDAIRVGANVTPPSALPVRLPQAGAEVTVGLPKPGPVQPPQVELELGLSGR